MVSKKQKAKSKKQKKTKKHDTTCADKSARLGM